MGASLSPHLTMMVFSGRQTEMVEFYPTSIRSLDQRDRPFPSTLISPLDGYDSQCRHDEVLQFYSVKNLNKM